jgi:hypothetical protein
MKRPIVPVVLLAAMLLRLPAFAGTTGKIAGEVKDAQTGEVLVGASVVIEGTSMGAATNLDGFYTILNVPPGKYTVVVTGVGFAKKSVTGVSVSVDLTTTINVAMAATVVDVGEEVVVTAERPAIKKDLTSSEARIDAAEIATLPVREVRDILTLQAGVTTGSDGAIHIRGGRTNEIAFWVDGMSISDVYDGGPSVQVDNKSVQELQVISGTFNAEYGQAMSGVVNIVTKDGDQRYRGSISTYLGDYLTPDRTYFNLNKVRALNNRNIEGSLSGPVPLVPSLTFYGSARYFKSDGWLFGNRTFNTDGTLVTGADTIKDAAGNMTGIRRPDTPIPMNGRVRISGQAKLTYEFSGTMRLNVSGVASSIDYRDYSHDWRLLPDGDVNKYDRGYNASVLWTHSVDPNSFYTANFGFVLKTFKEHLYEDPFDPRYIIDPAAQNRNLFEFIRKGTNLHHFKRSTQSRVAKLDYTNQISRMHQIKAGVSGSFYRLYLEDFSIAPVQDTIRVSGVLTNVYRPSIPAPSSPLYQEYTWKPFELAGYIQDKLEYERMIVNIGLRFDYFAARGKVLRDPQDPNVYLPQKLEHQAMSLGERLATWYRVVDPKYYFSPRFGISYPITDRGVLHFSYGHFLKNPSFSHLYQAPGYKVNAVDPIQGVFGNADLKPERTIMYELGLQQQLTELLSFDLTGFYRDTRDWVSTSAKIPVRDATGQTATTFYTTFINKDYANSRGVTLSVNKRPENDLLSLTFSYTFQVVEGINSSPDAEQAALTSNKEPVISLTPLDWDQTHTANLSVGVGREDWGVFALAQFGSGLPYTPVINQAEGRGEDASRVVQGNSRRRPATLDIDLRMFKNFTISTVTASVFVRVINLLDRRNEITVYGQTGRATATPEQMGIGGLGGLNRINTPEEFLLRPDFYSEPREVQVGLELNF